MKFAKSYMRSALKDHELTEISGLKGSFRVFHLDNPKVPVSKPSLHISVTPYGVTIQGDTPFEGDCENGVCASVCGPEVFPWFFEKLPEKELARRFFPRRWQREAVLPHMRIQLKKAQESLRDAEQDAKDILSAEGPVLMIPETDFSGEEARIQSWSSLIGWWAENHDTASQADLDGVGRLLRIPHYLDLELGVEYPLVNTGWVCAIHEKFIDLLP